MKVRIGHGIDVHQLLPGKPLILGGVKIESTIGVEGYSDGDIVIHAVVDAILGALAIGDIGKYFPSNEKKWKNVKSELFIINTLQKMKKLNYIIGNIDVNVILQKPVISKYIMKIKNSLSKLLEIPKNKISIKATTTDGLGFVGKKEGIVSTATVLLEYHESTN